MWKKVILVVLAAIIGAGILVLFNRSTILTHLVLARVKSMHNPVAEHEAVIWQQGPATPSATAAEQPPNIVFILLDDLGINDLSTFGGGVADGRAPTPNIDRLAEDGAISDHSLKPRRGTLWRLHMAPRPVPPPTLFQSN